jgi:CheY-like chemotaxis protein
MTNGTRSLHFHALSGNEETMSEKKQLLIVEDNEESARFLSQILENCGHEYQVARNGVEAFSAMRECRPELVLLDIMMPQKSGIHVLREMRNDPELKDVPVIVVTGMSEVTGVDLHSGREEPNGDEGDVVAHEFGSVLGDKLRSLRPDAVIEKPFTPLTVIDQVQSVLS